MNEKTNESRSKKLYQAVWRWHFYAGLFVVPFGILLAITGSIYLFKPYVEPLLCRNLYEVPVGPGTTTPEQQVEAASAVFPDASVTHYLPPPAPGRSAEVDLLTPGQEQIKVYVNPYTGEVPGFLEGDKTFMQRIRKLHGELLLGRFGTTIVELVACWAIVLLISGLYLWWPRNQKGSLAGILLIRVKSGGRTFWRDLHAVGGVYTSFLVLFLLATGLPWTDTWGEIFKSVQKSTAQATPPGRFFNPYKSKEPANGQPPLTISQVQQLAVALNFPAEIAIELPKGPAGTYAIHYDPTDPARQRMVHLDQYDGMIVKETTWEEYPATAKAIALGVRLHQGEYFGIANLLLSLLAALGMALQTISGFTMWWKRRPQGELGIPKLPENLAIPRFIFGITVALGVFFPLVGASLIALWILENALLKRVPKLRPILGL
jgi:uncharacterized iron-regulated membrane protein